MKSDSKFALHLVGGVVLFAGIVGAAMWLWNALVPDIFGWSEVGYWQMLGLLALAHLLFGHTGRGLHRLHEHHHLHERLHGMSHDERREFIRRRLRSFYRENRVEKSFADEVSEE